jgi:hypothetical protein
LRSLGIHLKSGPLSPHLIQNGKLDCCELTVLKPPETNDGRARVGVTKHCNNTRFAICLHHILIAVRDEK